MVKNRPLAGPLGYRINRFPRSDCLRSTRSPNPPRSVSTVVDKLWQIQAACRGLDAQIFYPVSEDDTDRAKAVCAACPVQATCLEYALAVREKEGVWGGATEAERRRIIRQRRRAAAKRRAMAQASA
ncbi:MAG TPA: WhiB family transcriptional regulator [Acidimicrobiales bacterium]|nr:WhiB family transcriptional regulator [Acidimicrobiales bacterium]